MRKKVIIGNWKMNNTLSESIDFVEKLKEKLANVMSVDIAICPSFVSLYTIKKLLEDSNIKVGSQNLYFEEKGAYTGEISAEMLKDINMDYCIVGHSERRQYFNETDLEVNNKVKKLLQYSITPIICVGENLSQRNENVHFDVIKSQIIGGLKDIEANKVTNIIIAYEPIWAIGTGVTASKEQAEEMCKYIRNVVMDIYDENVAENIRIQYGGSVNSKNAQDILTMPNIDGALVGGASLKPEFIDIVNSTI